jgi:hypothetical protein
MARVEIVRVAYRRGAPIHSSRKLFSNDHPVKLIMFVLQVCKQSKTTKFWNPFGSPLDRLLFLYGVFRIEKKTVLTIIRFLFVLLAKLALHWNETTEDMPNSAKSQSQSVCVDKTWNSANISRAGESGWAIP